MSDTNEEYDFPFLLDLYPDPTSDEFKEAERNLRRYAALLLRMYLRISGETDLTNPREDDKTEIGDDVAPL